jgi:hypothetical protein
MVGFLDGGIVDDDVVGWLHGWMAEWLDGWKVVWLEW